MYFLFFLSYFFSPCSIKLKPNNGSSPVGEIGARSFLCIRTKGEEGMRRQKGTRKR